MRILDSFLWLRSYPPVPWHVWGFLHFLHYLHCFLIALDGCFSVKTPFVKVRFARFARIAVFFDGAYRAVWAQIDAMDDIIAHLFCFSKSDLLGGWLLKRPSSSPIRFTAGSSLAYGTQAAPWGNPKISTLFSLLSVSQWKAGLACQAPTWLLFDGHLFRKRKVDCLTLLCGHHRISSTA